MVLKFLIKNLNILHSGKDMHVVLPALFKLGTIPAIAFAFNEKVTGWYMDNSFFIIMVMGAILVDHALGTVVHLFYKHDFVFKKNYLGLITKVGGCIAGYVVLEMLREIVKDADFIAIYMKMLIQTMVFLYPGGSALGNLSIITRGKLPPIGWMKKLDNFQKTADLNSLKTKNDYETNIDNN
ncbi:hypothetical protein [Elizabethkingia anophelis]|uniref:hypothetical protein n=1 Tax=Elizabethkingia anophelis TaxID=1117645 RepID=UPI002012DC94|nr:hypothetical protein [Elizabethkingia anophelis]MCL1690417.1 hypothetical protein [Elizabethkingia anophelis]